MFLFRTTRRSFSILFSNGTVQASDPNGPFLAGHDPSFGDTRAYRDVLDLRSPSGIGLQATATLQRPRTFWNRIFEVIQGNPFPIRYVNLKIEMSGQFNLINNLSSFPAPSANPNIQIQVYEGTFILRWNSNSANGPSGSISHLVRITLSYPPSTTANISGSILPVNPSPLVPGAVDSFSGSFSSVVPARIGEPTAVFAINNFTLNGFWKLIVLNR